MLVGFEFRLRRLYVIVFIVVSSLGGWLINSVVVIFSVMVCVTCL